MTGFSSIQSLLLISGVIMICGSFCMNQQKQHRIAILFLFTGGFLLFLLSSLQDPFLNLWDERFHALVAKNMMKHPLLPTLYDDPVLTMAYDRWDRAIVWLHKQPLFLWLITISFKIFGVSEVSLRLPSVIMASLLVLVTYRTVKLLTNEATGFLTAFLFSTSYYLMQLVAGRQELEHNDVAFLFFISCSIWVWTEYVFSDQKLWLILIGIFSGCAILTKWMPGLLVYLAYATYIFTGIFRKNEAWILRRRKLFKETVNFFLSLSITIFIVLPWQILIFTWYPTEAVQTYSYNALHFFQVVEGHGGSKWFYIENIHHLYGNVLIYFIPLGLILLFKRIKAPPTLPFSILILPVFVYLFFSLAKTKMLSYPFIVALPVYSGIAACLDFFHQQIIKRSRFPGLTGWVVTALLIFLVTFNWKLGWSDNPVKSIQTHNKSIFQSLHTRLPEDAVIFNVRGRHYIECMFYTDLPSYGFIPSKFQYEEIKKKGRKIAIFKQGDCLLPDYLSQDPETLIIIDEIQSYE